MKKNVSILLALAIILNPVIVKASEFQNCNKKPTDQQIINEQNLTEVAEPFKTEIVESSEENFVKNLAETNGISYAEANELNNKNTSDRIESRLPQYTTHYSTKKQYYKINSQITLVMDAEIKFIRDNIYGGSQIASVGSPYMGINAISGVTLSRWSGSGFNVEHDVNKARISTTGQAYIEISKSVSSGADLGGLSFSTTTSYGKLYSTGVKTYVMNVYASSL